MSLFHSKYRIESARLPKWDYSSPAWYFVTICTHNRKCFLSDIIDGSIVLKPAGIIANEEWLATPEIRRNVSIDEYVIMPNHFHAIIRIKSMPVDFVDPIDFVNPVDFVETPRCGVSLDETNNTVSSEMPHRNVSLEPMENAVTSGQGDETPHRDVSTKNSDDTENGKTPNHSNKRKPENWNPGVLGAIIGQYKNMVKKRIRKTVLPGFDWQPRFYDHIIRNNRELFAIRRYIRNNPAHWADDRNVIETQSTGRH